MLTRWLQARHDRHERALCDARDLLTFMGDGAYGEARTRARKHRVTGDGAGDRHWGRVAVQIARKTGYVIGATAADRYAETAEADRRMPNRRAIIAELVEISEAIRDMAQVASAATALHNAEAAIHRLAAKAKSREAEAAPASCARRLRSWRPPRPRTLPPCTRASIPHARRRRAMPSLDCARSFCRRGDMWKQYVGSDQPRCSTPFEVQRR